MTLARPIPLVSISYEADGDGYWYRIYRDGKQITAAWNHGSRRVAERDAKCWLKSRGML